MDVEALLAHLTGDFVLQSHWMAQEKTKRWWPALVHGLAYVIPFLVITQSLWALLVIAGTHVIIDRWRLARYVVWLKNCMAPRGWNPPWGQCTETGYPPETAAGFATALTVIADNTIHLAINAAALAWL